MIFFVRYAEVEHTIRVETRNGQTFVQFDGEPEETVDLTFFGNDCTYLRENRVFSANVVGNKDNYVAWRPAGNLEFTVESEYRRIMTLLRGQDVGAESNVYAKMPGKIVKVLVKLGDTVEKNQSVLVMEAMKMENEIRTRVAGKVSSLAVKEGQAVETGALLMELEVEEG